MDLVLFTAHYPYRGEAFLEDEIRIAEHYFSEILIVTLEKNTDHAIYYIPRNARVVPARGNNSRLFGILRALCRVVVSKKAVCEIGRAFKNRHEHGFYNALKSIVIDERTMMLLKKAERNWIDHEEKTVYYSYWLNGTATYLARNKRKLGGLCIARAHGGDCFFDRAFHPYRVQQLSALDNVFPISESGKNDLLTHYGDAVPKLANTLIVSHLGITKPADQMNPEGKSDSITIVSCSNVIPLKRLDLLIDALSLLKSEKIHWVHFGSGSEMETIQKMAEKKLNSNIITEFRGFTPKGEILRYYAENHIDVFINCSDAEGIPVSVMEAMAYGIPVVARDVGGTSELVDNSCGILLKGDVDGKAIAKAIESILGLDKAAYHTMQLSAFEHFSKGFMAERNYKQFFGEIIKRVNQRP